jgi:hypothetical protein
VFFPILACILDCICRDLAILARPTHVHTCWQPTEPWCSDCKISIILLGAFFINVEISINRLTSTSTSRKISINVEITFLYLLLPRPAFVVKFSSLVFHPISNPSRYRTFENLTQRWFSKMTITFWYELKIEKITLGRKKSASVYPPQGWGSEILDYPNSTSKCLCSNSCPALRFVPKFVNFSRSHLPFNWAQTWSGSYLSDTKSEKNTKKNQKVKKLDFH